MTFQIFGYTRGTTAPVEPLPPTVSDILKNTAKARARYPKYRPYEWRKSRANAPTSLLSYLLSLFTVTDTTDTAIASLYRIYEFFILDWNIAFRNELEYFSYHPEWTLSSLPDPADPDPLRYAILAVLVRLLSISFNRRIQRGLPRDAPPIILDFEELKSHPIILEEVPSWVDKVPPLLEPVFLPTAKGIKLPADHEDVSEEFKAMNIIAQMPHIHFT